MGRKNMERTEMLEVLSEIIGGELEEWEIGGVDVSIDDPIDDEKSFHYQYWLLENGNILIQEKETQREKAKTFREVLWRNCGLKNVCKKYESQYKRWKDENNSGVFYIAVQIHDDKVGKWKHSYEIMKTLLNNPYEERLHGLYLLLGEAGIGKTSFCHGMRNLAVSEIENVFKKEQAAFPFFFDLNEFCGGDFDKFIETELIEKYRVALRYPVFKKLCQEGIFMVVLDAWDQMRGMGKMQRMKQDIQKIGALWKKRGRVLITCRQSFYQQQLKKNEISEEIAGIYKLKGFDQTVALEYIQEYRKPNEEEKSAIEALIKKSWQYNADLFQKPLNVRLLAKHYYNITMRIDLTKKKTDTYALLGIAYEAWKEKKKIEDELFVKNFVFLALNAKFNRNDLFEQFRKEFTEDKWNAVIEQLKFLDFIYYNEQKREMEFKLAVFQEFLWSYFVLEELEQDPKKLVQRKHLLKNYLLSKEVREWVCKKLVQKDNGTDCLQSQLDYVKYRRTKEAGYIGSNALTLLCDLSMEPRYQNQFETIKSSLRRMPLKGVDFRSKNLSGTDFFGSELDGADFSYAILTNVNFAGADLTNTTWREHTQMNKCVFIMYEDALCVTAGTVTGGLLIYSVEDGRQEIISLREDRIQDLTYNNGSIYTISSDGMASYINGKGIIEHDEITHRELRSIASAGSKIKDVFYISSDDGSIYRYNWKSHTMHEIVYEYSLGQEMGEISEIRYYPYYNNEYIAFTISGEHRLVLLKIAGLHKGLVTTVCSAGSYKFGAIGFAEEMLIYSIIGKGVFAISVHEVLTDIADGEEPIEVTEKEMLNQEQMLLGLSDADTFFFSYADKIKKLFVVGKGAGEKIDKFYSVDLKSKKHIAIDLDREYNRQFYDIVPDQLEGFCMSKDGKYAAFSGGFLAVLQDMGSYFGPIGEPVEAKLSCEGVNITGCTGIDRSCKEFLLARGAYEYK